MEPMYSPDSPMGQAAGSTEPQGIASLSGGSRMEMSSPEVSRGECGCGGGGCNKCRANESTSEQLISSPRYVYAIGRIEPRFPDLSVEKEFAHALGRAETVGLTDRQALQVVLQEKQNRYLARQLCWILSIEGMQTYLLLPRDMSDIEALIEMLRPAPRLSDVDVVVGALGALAPSSLCNGLMLPTVTFDQLFSFDVDSLIKAIPRPDTILAEQFESAAEELFMRIMQLTDNLGAADEHRALNFLAVRYPAIYAASAEAYGRSASLSGVDVRPSRLRGVHRVMDVIFSFTSRHTDVTEKLFVRVDTTGKFPFLVTKLSHYYDR
jgi:hypothetical protein